ncbi:hypothetical protein BDW72DRAFT_210849 [Aspergillus terricola var. indicus]
MLARIDQLPLEILHLIVGYLRVDHDQQSPDQPSWYSLSLQPLLSLCLASKRLSSTIQPILYHEFMPGYGNSWRSKRYSWDRRLTSFIRTVAQRRDLAACVKRVYLHPYLLEPLDDNQEDGEYAVIADLSCLRSYPEVELPHERQQTGTEEIKDAVCAAGKTLGIKPQGQNRLAAADLITLLVAALPNLQHCSLDIGTFPLEVVRSAVLSAAMIPQLPLKTIDLSLHAPAARINLLSLERRVRALLEASPDVETLNIHMCSETWRRPPFPFLRNLKDLRVTFSRFSNEALKALLDSCNSLRSFTYEAGIRAFDGRDEPWDGTDHFQLINAVDCLERHCETLESLHLDLRRRGNCPDGSDPRDVFSFRKFRVLKHLFVNLDEFHTRFWGGSLEEDLHLLVKLLPPGIESLYFAGYIGNELPRLEKSLLGLAEASLEGEFPRLREVRWARYQELHQVHAVRTTFASAGVDFDYEDWPVTESTLGDGGQPPIPNFLDPNMVLDMEDPDL